MASPLTFSSFLLTERTREESERLHIMRAHFD